MNHRDDNGLTKLDYARLLLAALAYLAVQKQGDAVGLTILSPDGPQHLPPRADPRQLNRPLPRPGNRRPPPARFPDAAALAPLTARRQRALTVCVSDLYEADGEINRLLTRLRATSGDVLLLHLVARNELEFSYRGAVTFEDLETGQTLQARMPTSSAPPTSSTCASWLRASRSRQARRQGLDYAPA